MPESIEITMEECVERIKRNFSEKYLKPSKEGR